MSKPKNDTLLNNFHLLSYDVLDSTNEEARRLAEGGGSHGAVIWAKRQTAGRGRMGREWVSQEGNLFVSLLLAPDCKIADMAQLSFVAGLAAVETVAPIAPEDVITCKWPNDVMMGDKKLGGILLESFKAPDPDSPDHTMIDWVIVGVGINVESFPDGTLVPATCIKDAGVEIISAKIVLSRYVYNFSVLYDSWAKKGFAPIRKAWMRNAYKLGKKMEVKLPKETFSGIFRGLDESGKLEMEMADKSKKLVSAGDVFFDGTGGKEQGATGKRK